MDHQMHKTKTFLETLTTNELIKMADTMGIDIPLDLERIFIIQELIDAAEDVDEEAASDDRETVSEEAVDSDSKLESVILPHQYNVTYLEAMLRDPLWAFVYWEINSLDRKAYESSSEFKGYVLHVIPLPLHAGDSARDSFSISVGVEDNSWRIYLPPDISLFQVNLCVNRRGRQDVIISSRKIYVPQVLGPEDKAVKNNAKYPILSLSGIEEFDILRNVDRSARVHRFYNN
jgi:hypothetical protein